LVWLGYNEGVSNIEFPEHQLVTSLKNTFAGERRALKDLRNDAQNQIDAISVRMGEVESRLLRLDALGERMVEMGGLDKDAFDFDELPALGGPGPGEEAITDISALPDLVRHLQLLEESIDSREQQLTLVEDLILNTSLQDAIHPAGRPIKKGWISSYFGMRNDPFTGKRNMHRGMDFAGKEGSEVVAVAAGVITWAGERYGYGKLVEINHGKGYITRYGHNKTLEVEVGDRVRQGQTISRMGSSGRSTGPHVHFEVLRNGKVVDPLKYVERKRQLKLGSS
jgi:murein DD-endopeptidase MepM/ murein hydrolase activator NlpD